MPNSLENITWSELGKQNIQANKGQMSISDLEKDTKTTNNNKYSKSYQTTSPNKPIKHLSYRTKKNEMCVHTCLILSRVSFFKLKLYIKE